MSGGSSSEREYALLLAELHALDEDIETARATAWHGAHAAPWDVRGAQGAGPAPSGERVRLRDGAEILVRPVRPGDRHDIELGFEHLSAMSRLRSLRQPVEHLSARQLSELVDVDHRSAEVLVALMPGTGECVGGARFVRSADDPAQAEFTCAVVDAWQGRGVGTALIERLAAHARALGVERLTAVIVVGNEPARRLARRVARKLTEHREGGTIEIVGEAGG